MTKRIGRFVKKGTGKPTGKTGRLVPKKAKKRQIKFKNLVGGSRFV